MVSVDSNRQCGIIKWFHIEKDFGFIYHESTDGAVQEVFFHITQFKPKVIPQPGQIVEYYLSQCQKGLRATDCVILKDMDLFQHPKIMRLQHELQKLFTMKNLVSADSVTV